MADKHKSLRKNRGVTLGNDRKRVLLFATIAATNKMRVTSVPGYAIYTRQFCLQLYSQQNCETSSFASFCYDVLCFLFCLVFLQSCIFKSLSHCSIIGDVEIYGLKTVILHNGCVYYSSTVVLSQFVIIIALCNTCRNL